MKAILLGTNLIPTERAYFLFTLAYAANDIDPPRSKQWAEELLALAGKLDPSYNRSAIQKNAIVAISRTDPAEALSLLETIDDSIVGNSVSVPEDLRASGAREVYSQFWRTHHNATGLEIIRANAQTLAANNQYPFMAIAPMFEEALRLDPPAAQAWFYEVCSSYLSGSNKIRRSNAEFLQFVKLEWEHLPVPSRKVAVNAIVSRLNGATDSSNAKYLARITTTKGTFQLTDPNEELLFEAMSLVKQTDPSLAADVISKHLSFGVWRDADTSITGSSEMMVVTDKQSPDSSSRDLLIKGISANESMSSVISTASTDPGLAISQATNFPDPAAQLTALQYIMDLDKNRLSLGNLQSVDQQANAIIKDSKDPLIKLQGHVLLAERAAAAKDIATFTDEVLHGFDAGSVLVDQYIQTAPASTLEGCSAYLALTKLVRIGMCSRGLDDQLLGQIRVIPSTVMRAYLLMEAAQGSRACNEEKHKKASSGTV